MPRCNRPLGDQPDRHSMSICLFVDKSTQDGRVNVSVVSRNRRYPPKAELWGVSSFRPTFWDMSIYRFVDK